MEDEDGITSDLGNSETAGPQNATLNPNNISLPIATSELDESQNPTNDESSKPEILVSQPIPASQELDESKEGKLTSEMGDEDEGSRYSIERQRPSFESPRARLSRVLNSVDDETSRSSYPSQRGGTIDESSRVSFESAPAYERRRFADQDDASVNGSIQRESNTRDAFDSETNIEDDRVIWGTTVNADLCKKLFRDFLQRFSLEDEIEPHYLKVLEDIKETREFNLNINCEHVWRYFTETARGRVNLYNLAVRYPQEMIPLMDLVIHEEYLRMFPEENLELFWLSH